MLVVEPRDFERKTDALNGQFRIFDRSRTNSAGALLREYELTLWIATRLPITFQPVYGICPYSHIRLLHSAYAMLSSLRAFLILFKVREFTDHP